MREYNLVEQVTLDGKVHELHYIRSNDSLKWKIERLIYNHFGERSQFGLLEGVEHGRYLCALDENNKVIGITGISKSKRYKGCEVDYTCLDKEYRGNGIITAMIAAEIHRTRLDYFKTVILCSCWAIEDNKIHLSHAMNELGFARTGVITDYYSKYDTFCEECCIQYHKDCKCHETLYVLE